jgi:hypothetical protein
MAELGDKIRSLVPLNAIKERLRSRKEAGEVPAVGEPLATDIQFCPNCNAPLTGAFCDQCGQRNADLRRTVWSFLWEVTEDFITLESRFLRTAGLLVFLPGVLTKSYVEGKRASYVPPVRLYLIVSLLFFVSLSLTNVAIVRIVVEPVDQRSVSERVFDNVKGLNSLARLKEADPGETPGLIEQRERVRKFLAQLEERLISSGEPAEGGAQTPADIEIENGEVQIGDTEESEGTININGRLYRLQVRMFSALDAEAGEVEVPEDFLKESVENLERPESAADKFGIDVIRGFRTAALEPQKVNDLFNKWLPRGMILLLPFFAILMRVFYWGRNNRLIKQLIFSLHFHTYIFVVLTLLMLAQVFLGSLVSAWIFLGAVPLYLFVAMKVLSGQGWIRTTFKYAFVTTIYAVVLATTVGTITLFGLADL